MLQIFPGLKCLCNISAWLFGGNLGRPLPGRSSETYDSAFTDHTSQ